MGTKTEHYQFNQWEPGDDFLRSDFNEDNAKIDAAIFKAMPVFGYYEGNYNSSTSPYTRDIDLGFHPRAVLVMSAAHHYYPDYAASIFLTVEGADTDYLTITDNGFRVAPVLNQKDTSNTVGYPWGPYRYIAWR